MTDHGVQTVNLLRVRAMHALAPLPPGARTGRWSVSRPSPGRL